MLYNFWYNFNHTIYFFYYPIIPMVCFHSIKYFTPGLNPWALSCKSSVLTSLRINIIPRIVLVLANSIQSKLICLIILLAARLWWTWKSYTTFIVKHLSEKLDFRNYQNIFLPCNLQNSFFKPDDSSLFEQLFSLANSQTDLLNKELNIVEKSKTLNLIECKITTYLDSNRHNSPTAIWTTKSIMKHQVLLNEKEKKLLKL